MSRFCVGVFLSAVAVVAACSDDTLHGTAARVEDYWAGPEQTPVDSQRIPIPDDDVIAIDFGQVEVGSLAQRYLFITNRGNANLIVAAVDVSPSTSDDFTVSCIRQGVFQPGCAVSSSDPLVVAPGAELGLGVTYTPSGPGPDAGSVHLSLNTQLHAELRIDLAGEGVERDIEVCTLDCTGSDTDAGCQAAGYRCNDESGKENIVVDFGESPVGNDYRRHVRVRNLGQLDIVVIDLTLDALSSPAFSIDTNSSGIPGVLAPGGEDGFDVVYRPGDGQQHLGRVLVSSNDPNEPEVVIELAGQGLAPRVCPEPVSLDFGTVVVGQQEIRSFTLHNCGLMPLEIHRVELAQSPFSPDFSLVDPQSVAGTVPVGGSVEVQVAYSPGENGSDAGGVDIFTNDLASDPQTGKSGTVSLFGRGQSLVCDLKPDPQAVVFGPVEIGNSSQIELQLTNQGNGPCELDHVEILQNSPAGEFSLPSAPSQVTIDPGLSESVLVSYGPTDYGPDTGLLGVFANDKDGNEIHVDLNGFGTWPGGQGRWPSAR
ncbi:MAG: choice-of-anchor D domain-containing protein [Deltaproteobacteria bacterium]|nr:MAG: choice-of-anchor D domain-containing protein [Deltaproteobacteria bacterium]